MRRWFLIMAAAVAFAIAAGGHLMAALVLFWMLDAMLAPRQAGKCFTAIFNGVAMDFGAGDLGITPISGKVGTFTVQDWDWDTTSEKDVVKNASGVTITATYFDPTQTATFNVVISGTGIANAQAQIILPPRGTICAINSSLYPAIAGTNWIIEKAKIKATNTKNKIASFELMQYPAITAAASS
jgi:hypothetical protein